MGIDADNIQFKDPSPVSNAEINAVEIARERRRLAARLRDEFAGRWAVISDGHVSIKSAGVVRRRLVERGDPWGGFEMQSRKSEDTPGTYCILARYVGEDAVPPAIDDEDTAATDPVDAVKVED